VNFALQLETGGALPPEVEYRWDPDTDILSARLRAVGGTEGPSGAVEVAGDDGSWLIIDLDAGRIAGVEVAVWPDVAKRSRLVPPPSSADAAARIPSVGGAGPAAVQLATTLFAEADQAERTIHFRLGDARAARAVRLAPDLLLELDARDGLAGVWLLNVPPFPTDA
jgi:hypothetical protein